VAHDLHLVTIGHKEDFDLNLALVVLLHLYECAGADVLVLVQPEGT
jgi:hypothetical protein